MKTAVVFVLTLSGLSALPADVFREYYYIKELKTWDEAQSYCREKFTDLATVDNQDNNDKLLGVLQDTREYAWLGLYDDMKDWAWSQGDAVNNTFTKWYKGQPNAKYSEEACVAMKAIGPWDDTQCLDTRPAICYYEPGPTKYILVTTKMTWQEAVEYCRTRYTDLVTVKSTSENNLVKPLLSRRSWIGLHRKTWAFWSDQTPRTFTNWDMAEPFMQGQMKSCVAVHTATGTWWVVDCNTKQNFICQAVSPYRQKRFKLMFHSEVDLNDAALQQQILEQLHAKLEKQGVPDFKLRWIKTDGQTFHKEPKKKEDVPCG